ncbi:MAG TPA: PTS sugar transporter subunit IIA [Gemmataceae bacterium]
MAVLEGDAGLPIIELPAEVDTPEAAVRFLIAALIRAGSLPAAVADEVFRQVWQREQLGPTAIGRGVAIPHAKVRTAVGSIRMVGRCTRPFNWPGALDGNPVGMVCLLVVQEDSPGSLCHELVRLSRQLRGG